MTLSVVLITFNEEANLRRTLESVQPLVSGQDGVAGEIIVVDNGSTDNTVSIARELGARVYSEPWKGYAAQKNSAIDKASGDWVLSIDADEALSPALAAEIRQITTRDDSNSPVGFAVPRRNFFLGRWIRHAGFYPDAKIRLFRRGSGRFLERPVHEVIQVDGPTAVLRHALLHNAYPTLSAYIATMNRYSSLGAEIAVSTGHRRFSFLNIVLRPLATFLSMYLFRLGFLDGQEGFLLCLYHSVYVSWKYSKAWEIARSKNLSS